MTTRRQVILVGGGRMGSAFARSMRAARVTFSPVRGRAERWPLPPRRGAIRTVFLAVTDAAIPDSAAKLLALEALHKGDTVVHLAGMRGPSELAALSAVGVHTGALHPLVAVASRESAPLLKGFAATFEGDRQALAAVRAVSTRVGLDVYALASVDRARYHAAAALCATGGVALAQSAVVLFRALGCEVSERDASRFSASLLASVAHNVGREGADGALASPLMRGDTRSVERHLDAMAVHPPAAMLYRAALAQVVASLDARGTVDPAVLDRAREILAAR
jgi:predicted short-subunit dehydrogenase-like oxidoreductase (DUF2520 family)